LGIIPGAPLRDDAERVRFTDRRFGAMTTSGKATFVSFGKAVLLLLCRLPVRRPDQSIRHEERTPAMLQDDDLMRQRWFPLFRGFQVDERLAERIFREVVNAYAAPDRHYHNLDHVLHVLDTLDRLAPPPEGVVILHLAAWFHDKVYDRRRDDNEARSAAEAVQALRLLQLPEPLIATVRQLILLTKTHQAGPDDSLAPYLLDADLAILGADEARYRAYAEQIRKEYAWVPEDAYRSGRSQVLSAFLGRERIFQTEPLYHTLEKRARENMQSEIQTLAQS
jgi:predicted metal-dependent HD superfamily phosphohydrolase